MTSSQNIHIQPIKRRGITIHLIGILINIGILILLPIQLNKISIGPLYVFLLLLFVVSILLMLLLSYRLYSLSVAEYSITRDGVYLKWGFREQLIPMNDILWIRVEGDLSTPLSLPSFSWMGSTHGLSSQQDLGEVEFMFSSFHNITLIGTSEKVYGISPENQNVFLQQFQRSLEFGILAGVTEISVQPNFLLVEIWKLPAARNLLFPAIIFSTALFIWVGFAIPNFQQVSLGFSAIGTPLSTVPAIQLLLLPAINFFLLIISVWLATFFYRHEETHPVISILFAANAFTSFIFLIALFQILKVS
jgi:hypothetical protein